MTLELQYNWKLSFCADSSKMTGNPQYGDLFKEIF